MSVGDAPESKHAKIFVGGVSIHTTDEGFKTAFAKFGEIIDSIILRDPETNRSRGFGFVTFKRSESVERVLDARPITIDDREVEVKRAIPKESNNPQAHSKTNKVFIGGLPNDISEKELKDFFSYYGEITDVELIYKDSVFRGFGFITFYNCDSVDKVIVEGAFDLRDKGQKCRVSKAGQRTPKARQFPQPGEYGAYGGGGPYGGGATGQMQPSPGYFGGGGGGESYYSSGHDYNEYSAPSKGGYGYGGGISNHGPPSGGYDSRSYGGGGGGGPMHSDFSHQSSGAYSYGYGHGGGGPGYGGGDGSQYQSTPSYKSEGGRGGGRGGRARYKPY